MDEIDEINRAEMFSIKENETPLLFVMSFDGRLPKENIAQIKADWDKSWALSGRECPAPLFFLSGGVRLELIKKEDIKQDG